MAVGLGRKRILVTGAAGFLGKNLVRRLVREGADVFALDRGDFRAPSVRCFKTDVLGSPSILKELIDECDIVFHLAALSSAHMSREFENPFTFNVNTLLRVLSLADQNRQKKRVIFSSSSVVYDGNSVPSKEDSASIAPVNWYAASKAAGELVCQHFSSYRNVETVTLRIFCGYGPGEEHKGIYASPPTLFIKDMIEKRPAQIWGDGRQERDFVYVDDIVDAFILAATKPVQGGIFNVGSGMSTSFLELVKITNEILQTDIEPIFITPRLSSYIRKTLADSTKAARELGFRPKTTLRAGLANTVAFLKESRRHPKMESIVSS